jgi:hypothetical protein
MAATLMSISLRVKQVLSGKAPQVKRGGREDVHTGHFSKIQDALWNVGDIHFFWETKDFRMVSNQVFSGGVKTEIDIQARIEQYSAKYSAGIFGQHF